MLMTLGVKYGIIPLIGDIEVTPIGLFTQTATQITGDSIHITITTKYFMNFELLLKNV
jgi:hypothetical protein